MELDELCTQSLEDVAAAIRSRDVSPVAVTEAMLRRIERLDPQLNAYLTVTADAALEEARAAERAIAGGEYRGALHGVPIAHKDLFQTKGVRTTAGSKILDNWLPDEDATVVAKLREAGAVSLGKLGMHEWAFGVTSDNVHFGPVRNPWDTSRIPGGSSGGSGAATAAGLAFATLGSDTGGSIRIPAHFCGCVGMMPTYGRASLHGAVPLSWTLDHPGPLTRTVRDAAIVLQAIAGHDPRDPATEQPPAPDWLDGIEAGAKGLRIGVPKQHFWESLDADVNRLVRQAIDDLASNGAEVRDVEFPQATAWSAANGVVTLVEAAAFHQPNFPSRRGDYGPSVAGLLDAGAQLKGTAYVEARRALEQARRHDADAILDGVDVLAVPTVPMPAPTIELMRSDDATLGIVSLTGVFDFTGQPVLAVPCGLATGDLPVGISFVARRWDEASAFRAGRAYEQIRGPFPLPPIARGS
jgi:aspartyl-tRNA(Asn)/glutamyl-tRNA(Gln) amidotransferase subunit A